MRPAVFLDRDGVINVDHGYVSRWEEFEFLPNVPETLAHLQDAGYLLIVISNQSGIGRGFYTESDLEALNRAISGYLRDTAGVSVTGFYHCPHHPSEAIGRYRVHCDCRKPAPGMIKQAALDHQIDLSSSLLVGDKESDIQAGRAAGVARLFLVRDGLRSTDQEVFEVLSALSDLPNLL